MFGQTKVGVAQAADSGGHGPRCAPRKAARRPWHRLPGQHWEPRSLWLLPLHPRVRGWLTNLAATDHLDLLPSRLLLPGRPLLTWQGRAAEVLCLRVTRCGPGRALRAPKPRDTSGAHSWGEGPPPESAPLASLMVAGSGSGLTVSAGRGWQGWGATACCAAGLTPGPRGQDRERWGRAQWQGGWPELRASAQRLQVRSWAPAARDPRKGWPLVQHELNTAWPMSTPKEPTGACRGSPS